MVPCESLMGRGRATEAPAPLMTAGSGSERWRELGVLVRVGYQIALSLRIWADGVEGLDDVEAVCAVGLGDVDVVREMVALAIQFHRPFGCVEAQSAFESCDNLVAVGRPGFVDRFRPEVPTGPDRVGRVGDIRVVGTKASLPVSDPLLIRGVA